MENNKEQPIFTISAIFPLNNSPEPVKLSGAHFSVEGTAIHYAKSLATQYKTLINVYRNGDKIHSFDYRPNKPKSISGSEISTGDKK